jgi:inhibitor of cysteine peptidase
MKVTTTLIFATALLAALLTVSNLQGNTPTHTNYAGDSKPQPVLKKFSSYNELKFFLAKAYADSVKRYRVFDMVGVPVLEATLASKPRFSTTNIQVAGVDEEDVVKTDGDYIYLARENLILIVRAYPAEKASLLSMIKAAGPVNGLYVNGDRLIAITGTQYHPIPVMVECPPNKCPIQRQRPRLTTNSTIQVFDISDRKNPMEVRRASVSGMPLTSRMIGSYVYLITSEPVIVPLDRDEIALPSYSDGLQVYYMRPDQIYYADMPGHGYSYTNIMVVNIRNVSEEPAVTTVLSPASVIYVSKKNIYLASIRWLDEEETVIHRLSVDGPRVTPVAVGTVPGHPLNQFSLDEYDGRLRIATTLNEPAGGSTNNVYVLDLELRLVGKLEGLAPREKIYSVRFMGDKAYIVTFRKVDPLFVVDMKELRVLGKLKIPGYSSYLHPYGENYLIGVGKDAKPAEEGDFAWFQGLKISLFDISDMSNPREVDSLILGDRGTESEVLHNHRAFLFDEERGILVLPILLAVVDRGDYAGRPPANAYGEYVFQGAYVLKITPQDGIKIVGRITHLTDNADLLRSGEFFTSHYAIKRALFIGDILYTISDGRVLLNDIQTLRELAGIILPQQSG